MENVTVVVSPDSVEQVNVCLPLAGGGMTRVALPSVVPIEVESRNHQSVVPAAILSARAAMACEAIPGMIL